MGNVRKLTPTLLPGALLACAVAGGALCVAGCASESREAYNGP